MKSVLCFICVGLSLCYTVCSQSLSPQEWEEICDHQGADWTNSFQEFDIRNIRLLSTEQLSTAWERRYESIEEWNEEQRMYEDFLVYNPDCSYYVNLLASVWIESRSGKYYAIADVDQSVMIGIPSEKRTIRIASCGPSCRYEEAYWLDRNRVVLLGYFDDVQDQVSRTVPALAMVDIREHKKYIFDIPYAYRPESGTYIAPYDRRLIYSDGQKE